ncbi:hypothetical protein HBI56_033120 [Parastagonospora nodorum]|uniref:Methyltransferase type 12 domain-containing protein n=1 Tax=Phaeosphaeria nodorum (strain SN15 / ATCC MYA-4574 / FGSC 10173) TaxID=321614 RepID=A0A7U2EYU0_PHANO|nr:hypothetical protein HBH56_020910 [Parastagonospora nodorum]QRC95462.1 hypothetical protein JI435_031460 [Parastagonospora nodorum SN15]KAH3936957.1 hypothetical protein HBH54_013580 [Parastagonospora nodorum]KAH3943982.1 hypothetical protein HBH53_163170 [Parastagonospora nodorum]KAH3967564.1 hypothetical protein HBH51_137310 [Parastagonospora nodorum]
MASTFETSLGPERSYHNTKSAYILPNDKPEHDRLEAQSKCIFELMGKRIIHAPLSATNVHKALDIGCGTGIVTHEIASQFPDAQVYGLDLSPVPNIREKLPNIEYVQGNIIDIATPHEPDARFKHNSFDYIFSRFLVVGMTDWEGYIARCVALAKPGVLIPFSVTGEVADDIIRRGLKCTISTWRCTTFQTR